MKVFLLEENGLLKIDILVLFSKLIKLGFTTADVDGKTYFVAFDLP